MRAQRKEERKQHNIHERNENVCWAYVYIENNNGTQERKIKHKTESDMKISFRCFFDRTRCVREIRMAE